LKRFPEEDTFQPPINSAYSFLRVFIPKKGYSGQTLMKLVTTNMTATTISTIASIPVITSLMQSTAMIAATKMRIDLSTVPMFFFIIEI